MTTATATATLGLWTHPTTGQIRLYVNGYNNPFEQRKMWFSCVSEKDDAEMLCGKGYAPHELGEAHSAILSAVGIENGGWKALLAIAK